jgi:hypothetical protein
VAPRKARKAKNSAADATPLSDQRLIANLLALHLVKDQPTAQQPAILAGAGFSIQEIARLLRMLPNTVSVALLRGARKTVRKKAVRGDR